MGQTIEVSIDNHGGILLPQELKNRLGLLPGMTMVVEEDDEERVCLWVQTESPELVDKQGIIVVAHEKSLPWLQRIKKGSDSGLVSAHSVAELYAILTTLPMKPRISPIVA